MKLTSLLQLVDKLQQAGKIDNLQQVCGISGCVGSHVKTNFQKDWSAQNLQLYPV